ncbi:MAG: 50S ribosomal protein L9 [Bacteroidota bacterium]
MEVILREDIQGLGYKNDTVFVKSGYGRNYLIPRGIAILASTSNKKMIEEEIRQASHKAEKAKKDAETIANRIGEMVIEIKTKAGDKGKIFGAVTPIQVAEALAAKGHQVDRKRISFEQKIKELGEYTAILNLHKEVHHPVNLKVVAE